MTLTTAKRFTLRPMTPQFQTGEVVRVVDAPAEVAVPGDEAVVEEIAGPNDDGDGWLLTLRLCREGAGEPMVILAEDDLEATGFGEDAGGQRVPLSALPEQPEPYDCLELRLFTEITDGIEAARVAQSIEHEIGALLGGAAV